MASLIGTAYAAARGLGGVGKMAIGGAAGRMALGGAVGAAYGMATNEYNNPNMAFERVLRTTAMGAGIGGLTRLFTPAIKFNKVAGAGSDVAGAIGPRNRFGEFGSEFTGPRLRSGHFFSQARTKVTSSGMPVGLSAMGKGISWATGAAFNAKGLRNVRAVRQAGVTEALEPGFIGPANRAQGPLGAGSSYMAQLNKSPMAGMMTAAGVAIRYPVATAATIGAGVAAVNYGSDSPYSSRNDMMMHSTNGLVQGLHSGRHG